MMIVVVGISYSVEKRYQEKIKMPDAITISLHLRPNIVYQM